MDKRILSLFDHGDEMAIIDVQDDLFDPARIKELTMKKIHSRAPGPMTGCTAKKKRTVRRSFLIAAIVAVFLIGTALASGVIIYNSGLQSYFRLSDEALQELIDTNNPLISESIASDSHNGITISVAQAIADEKSAYIALNVNGLIFDENTELVLDGFSASLDGTPASNLSRSFYTGLSWNGSQYIYDNGLPARLTDEGLPIPSYMDPDGTIEYDISISPGQGDNAPLVGQEIVITITRICARPISTMYSEATHVLAEGPWVLRWTLTGSESRRSVSLNAPLGTSGAIVTSVTLSPISAAVSYDYPARYAEETAYDCNGNETTTTVLQTPPVLCGFVLHDGTEMKNILGGSLEGYPNDEMQVFVTEASLTRIIDPQQVSALLFRDAGCGDIPESEIEHFIVPLE